MWPCCPSQLAGHGHRHHRAGRPVRVDHQLGLSGRPRHRTSLAGDDVPGKVRVKLVGGLPGGQNQAEARRDHLGVGHPGLGAAQAGVRPIDRFGADQADVRSPGCPAAWPGPSALPSMPSHRRRWAESPEPAWGAPRLPRAEPWPWAGPRKSVPAEARRRVAVIAAITNSTIKIPITGAVTGRCCGESCAPPPRLFYNNRPFRATALVRGMRERPRPTEGGASRPNHDSNTRSLQDTAGRPGGRGRDHRGGLQAPGGQVPPRREPFARCGPPHARPERGLRGPQRPAAPRRV